MRNRKLILSFTLVLLMFVLPITVNAQFKTKRPDLEITKMYLKGDCQIIIVIMNNGPGKLLPSAYDMKKGAGIQMYKNRMPWGGIMLGAVDQKKALVNPGGKIIYKWFPAVANLKLPKGVSLLKAVIDIDNSVNEANELNNSLTKKVNCIEMANISQVFGDSCMGYGTPTSRCFSVYGGDFGSTAGNTLVYVNGTVVQSEMWHDDSFLLVIPDGILNLGVNNLVYLKRNGVLVSNEKTFIPYAEVTSVTPESLIKTGFGRSNLKKGVIVETAWLFSQGNYKIFFGQTEMPIISWTPLSWPAAKIRVSIPSSLPLGKHPVRIKENGIIVSHPNLTTPVFEYK